MIEVKECTFEPFCVIGLVGEAGKGSGALWTKMNKSGKQLMPLARRDDDGDIMGAWGLTTEDTLSFRLPKKDDPHLLYMAGLEVEDTAHPPVGFTKWIVPGSDYIYGLVQNSKKETLDALLQYAEAKDLEIIGYPQEFMPPQTVGASGTQNTMYLFVPVKNGLDE